MPSSIYALDTEEFCDGNFPVLLLVAVTCTSEEQDYD